LHIRGTVGFAPAGDKKPNGVAAVRMPILMEVIFKCGIYKRDAQLG
jgi:hypothetical protein